MAIQSKTNKYSCPQCRLRIDKDDLEGIFKTRIEQFIISEEEINAYSKSSNQEIQLKKDEIEFVQKQIEESQTKMDKLITLNIEGQIPNDGFKNHYEPLFERKGQLEQSITNLNNELENMLQAKGSFSVVLDKSKSLYKNWNKLNRPEKRFIVQSVTNRIDFDGKHIKFNLKQIAPLSSLELSQNGQPNGTISWLGEKQLRL